MIVDPASAPRDTAPNGGALVYLSRAGGIIQFGAYIDRLMPGAVSSQRHWHSAEDEFAFVLSGHATLIDDDGAHPLAPGDACCWRHAEPNGHHIRNDSDQAFSYLIVGSRVSGDVCTYPDAGERQVNTETDWWIEDQEGQHRKGGALPQHLLNLAPRWGRAFDGIIFPHVIKPDSVPGQSGSGYPGGRGALGTYIATPLSDAGGISQFGAFTEVLMPGAQSSHRHWHETEDEFLYVLDGTVTVVENDGAHDLAPGGCACWPRGVPNAHCVQNRTATPVRYFVTGTRMAEDACHYPEIDLHYTRRGGFSAMTHKDGTPYPGWPQETKT